MEDFDSVWKILLKCQSNVDPAKKSRVVKVGSSAAPWPITQKRIVFCIFDSLVLSRFHKVYSMSHISRHETKRIPL